MKTDEVEAKTSRMPIARRGAVIEPVRKRTIWLGPPGAMVALGLALLIFAKESPWPWRASGVGVAMVVGGWLWFTSSWREESRAQLILLLREQLSPFTGPNELRPRRWVGINAPGKLKIHYGQGAPATHPGFAAQVCTVVEEITGYSYEVSKHSVKQSVVVLELDTSPTPEQAPDTRDETQKRGELLLTQILPGNELRRVEHDDTAQPCRFEGAIGPELSLRLSSPAMARKIEGSFNRLMPGRWRVSFDLEQDTFKFERRPVMIDYAPLLAEHIVPGNDAVATYVDAEVLVGLDEDGNTTAWCPRKDPHHMLVGPTGSGKTNTIRTQVFQFTAMGWPVWVADGKGIEFIGLRSWPNVQIVATTLTDQIAVLYRAKQLMEHRYRMIEEGRSAPGEFEPLLLVLDEWVIMRGRLQDWWVRNKPKGAPSKCPVVEWVGELLRMARSAQIHLIFGLQRPDAEYFGADMRDNIQQRTAMGKLSPEGARMVWEKPHIGISVPRNKKGRATSTNRAGQPVEVQTFYTPDPYLARPGSDDARVLEQLKPAQAVHPRYVIVPPDEDYDIDGEEIPVDFYAWCEAEWALATDRPDIDPVEIAANADRTNSRAASSTAALLGLSTSSAPARQISAASLDAAPAPVEDDEADANGAAEEPGHDDVAPVAAGPGPMGLVRGDGLGVKRDVASVGAAQRPRLRLVDDVAAAAPAVPDVDEVDAISTAGDEDGYADAETFTPSELQPGWLVLEDESSQHWVTVEDIGADLFDESAIAIGWRDDDDQDGILSLSEDDVVTARPFLEE